MIETLRDTIIAIATPMGEGAISVIRVSGESAIKIVASRFNGKIDLAITKSHTAHFGRIVDTSGNVIDEVVCTVFREPRSFTGENTVEISCHGGIQVTRRVFECILEAGVRTAEPGEFTQRAFLNGKLDLAQAEAVADLIRAQSEKAYKTSLDQLEGMLSKQIRFIQQQLIDAISLLELELDFAEEDIELINKQRVEGLFDYGIIEIDNLLRTYKYGKVWREGVRVALIGVPNAGKSSLLNALLKEERAIVTDIPGTTRDFIEEKLVIDGILFRAVDTAGLRKAKDPIEREGVKRTWKVIENSDIVVLVHDSTKIFTVEEKKFLKTINTDAGHRRVIIVNNKIDLLKKKSLQKIIHKTNVAIETSAKNYSGIDELKKALVKNIFGGKKIESRESVTITNGRHYSALMKTKKGLTAALESLKSGKSGEFIAVDLRLAIDSMGEIVGLVTTEEILNNIFSKFCIGK